MAMKRKHRDWLWAFAFIGPTVLGLYLFFIYHNLAYVAAARTANPNEVKRFLSFLASERHAEILGEVWPTAFKDSATNFFARYDWLDTNYIIDTMNYGYPLPIAGRNAGPVYGLLGNELDKLFQEPQSGNRIPAIESIINEEIRRLSQITQVF